MVVPINLALIFSCSNIFYRRSGGRRFILFQIIFHIHETAIVWIHLAVLLGRNRQRIKFLSVVLFILTSSRI
jgi:hypothetical protein